MCQPSELLRSTELPEGTEEDNFRRADVPELGERRVSRSQYGYLLQEVSNLANQNNLNLLEHTIFHTDRDYLVILQMEESPGSLPEQGPTGLNIPVFTQ